MDKDIMSNNRVELAGTVVSDLEFSHEIHGEKFYEFMLECPRFSENSDTIRIIVSERIMDTQADFKGCLLKITGQFRSYNKKMPDGHVRLILNVFVREVELIKELPYADETNNIHIEGYLCKDTNYRKTPLERDISDALMAVNRPFGKSDYIPCILWNRNARWSRGWKMGDRFKFDGRIQSRDYQKTLEDGSTEIRTAYEVSVHTAEFIPTEEEEMEPEEVQAV